LGYIGLPTAAILASKGVNVLGVDIKQEAVEKVNRGEIHIVEPELEVIVKRVVLAGKLRAATRPESADVFLIAVPTPFMNDHQPDLSFIESAAKSIAPVLTKDNLIILESTSPVGTTEMLSEWLSKLRLDLSFPHQSGESSDIRIAYCPERVLPGKIVKELVGNDRVIGGLTKRCAEIAVKFYTLFVTGTCLITDARTAELCKLTENAFRDVNIAFANEISIICDKLNINVWELIHLANRHPRVQILQPGPGVGGHCIAVDPWFIVDSTPEHAQLIKVARCINDGKPSFVVKKIRDVASDLKSPTIACFGLSFKANVDDLRESPAIEIVLRLVSERIGTILVVDPYISQLPINLKHLDLELVTLNYALESADILVLLVDHDEFLNVDRNLINKKILVDTRGFWSS
jgi:UDP-N-acetyl-D-mannosaminuronic acid dehydrogenase